jgi:heptosyltransferase-3/putative inorganic carbon (HCO3(-)) transporter
MKLEGEGENASTENSTAFRHGFRARPIILQLQVCGLCGITFLSFFPSLFHYQEYAFFLLFGLTLALARVEKINPFVRTRLDLPLFAFVSWVLLTVPFSIDPAYSFSEWRKFVAHMLVFYWAMFVLRLHGAADPARKVLLAMVLGSLALSLFALEDFLLRGGSWRDRLVRAGAPLSDYNWLTTYLVLVIPVLIGWLMNQSSLVARALGLSSLAASVLAQLAAYTRAGWVAHFVQALCFALIIRRQQLIVWFLVGAILAGSVVFVSLSLSGYQQDTLNPWTFSARVKTWRLGFQQLVEHPVVGAGFGNDTFSKLYMAEIEADKSKGPVEKVLPALHNTFAMVLMGSGIPALLFFVWIMVRTIQKLVSGIRELSLRHAGMLLLPPAIALSVLGFVVRNAFDYMFAGSLATLFWILVAVGFSIKDNHCRLSGLLNARTEPGTL